MAVTIRLTRKGAKKKAFYRVVAADSRFPRDGRFLENLGTYDPRKEKDEDKYTLKMDRIQHWIDQGATTSDTVRSILRRVARV